ncbi:DUF2486 family protein [Paraburkholderia sp. PREW-6R]|uniref:DUF2486 family protein n=1 Tax=Paraburkholderia sp. PREW-6R TaxID=3141544 RepID=UPI0031F49D76
MSDPNDNSIPVLHEILVPGKRAQPHPASNEAAVAADPSTPREPSFASEPAFAPQARHPQEPALMPRPSRAAEPVSAPAYPHEPDRGHLPRRVPSGQASQANQANHAAGQEAALAGVFDRVEPVTPLEAGATVPPDIAQDAAATPPSELDADVIAERLRGRFAGFLTGEGRAMIEARCRDALQDHTSWLVSHITREVALTLETEMTGWVREAVAEEIARRG